MKLHKEVYEPGYSVDMKKSGNINIFEPTDMSCANDFPKCATLFKREGLFSFFERITSFNPKLSYYFTQS